MKKNTILFNINNKAVVTRRHHVDSYRVSVAIACKPLNSNIMS